MADTMMTFGNDNLCQFMTKNEIKEKAPYIFATEATNPNVSKNYLFASTETIIDDMQKLGWGVTACKQQRANKRSNVRSFHMVCFQNPDVFVTKENENGEEVIDSFPRIILTNSHDGFNSFKFMVGFFRCVSSNGLIVATQTFESLSIRHKGYNFEELRQMVAKAIEAVSETVKSMNVMQEKVLTEEQKRELAISALKIRDGIEDEEKLNITDEDINELLEPKRDEDKGDNLWNVFNVLQEKILSGDFYRTKDNGKSRKARPITGAAKDIEVNQQLFKVAYEYANAA